MALAEFHSLVSSIINQGTVADSVIPTFTRQAARWLERNYSFKYMERYVTFSIDADAANPRFLDFPLRFKSFGDQGFIRIVQSNGKYTYLNQIDPQQLDELEEAIPTTFWFDGDSYIVLGQTPEDDYDAEMSYIQYTDWPTVTTGTPWLLENGEDVLLARTIMYAQPYINDPKLLADYKLIFDEGIRTLLLADEEWRRSNRSEVMQYS